MKKFLPYILIIFTIISGAFSLVENANAQAGSPKKGSCYVTTAGIGGGEFFAGYMAYDPCMTLRMNNVIITARNWRPITAAQQGLCTPPGYTIVNGATIGLGLVNTPTTSIQLTCEGRGWDWDPSYTITNGKIQSVVNVGGSNNNQSNNTSDPNAIGTCHTPNNTEVPPRLSFQGTKADCTAAGSNDWRPNSTNPDTGGGGAQTTDNSLQSKLPPCSVTSGEGISGCLVVLAYYLIYTMPMMLLLIVGELFNAMLAVTLSGMIYGSTFISEAWRIVRDFSNLFFILILLYISIKMILGLGGAEVKKMIAQVVVIALLINFSMFFTKVVIDSSNILALIFYNKIDIKVNGKAPPYTPSIKTEKTGVPQKDFAGGIVGAFDPSKGLSEKAFKGAQTSYLTLTNFVLAAAAPATGGISLFYIGGENKINVGLFLSVIVVAAIIALLASYALLMASIAFMGRVIELWLCIIFSPFAFMSLVVPKLKSIDYLGWDSWLHRLLSVAFMAPVFMFFLLLISKIIQAPNSLNGLVDDKNPGITGSFMLIVIPAIIYCSLLWKATEYAKKSGGDFANAAIKVVDGVTKGVALGAGALAIGAATGGVGLAATATLGRAGAAVATKGVSMAKSGGAFNKFVGRNLSTLGRGMQGTEVNIRKLPGISNLTKKVGLKDEVGSFGKAMGWDTSGGWKGVKERQDKRALELQEHREKDDTKAEKRKLDVAKANLVEEEIKLNTSSFSKELHDAKEKLEAEEIKLNTSSFSKELHDAKEKLEAEEIKLKVGTENTELSRAIAAREAAELPIKAELENYDKTIGKFEKDLNNASKVFANIKDSGTPEEKAEAQKKVNEAKSGLKFYQDKKKALRTSAGLDSLDTDILAKQKAYDTAALGLGRYKKDVADKQRSYDTAALGLGRYKKDVADKQRSYDTEAARLLTLKKDVVDAQREFDKAASESAFEFAKELTSPLNNTWNLFRTLGLHDKGQATATAIKIRQKAGEHK